MPSSKPRPRPIHTNLARRYADELTALGLIGEFPGVLEHLDRADALAAAARATDDRFEVEREQVTAELAAGTLTPEKARERLIEAQATTDVGNVAGAALSDASGRAGRQAGALITDRGEALVTDVFAPAAVEIIAAAEEHLSNVPEDCETSDDALRAGGKAPEAWTALLELEERWDRLRALVKRLKTDHYLAGHSLDSRVFVTGDPKGRTAALVGGIRAGSGLRVVTAEQVEAEAAGRERAEYDRRLAEAGLPAGYQSHVPLTASRRR